MPASGSYQVRLAYTAHQNRATRVPVEIHHADGQQTVTVNQRRRPPLDQHFVSLGVFAFDQDRPAVVVVSNRDTDGYVVIDAVQWILAD